MPKKLWDPPRGKLQAQNQGLTLLWGMMGGRSQLLFSTLFLTSTPPPFESARPSSVPQTHFPRFLTSHSAHLTKYFFPVHLKGHPPDRLPPILPAQQNVSLSSAFPQLYDFMASFPLSTGMTAGCLCLLEIVGL